MSPLKNNPVKEIEEAIAAAVLALTGQEVRVEIDAIEFAEPTNLAKVSLSVWDKASTGMFPDAI